MENKAEDQQLKGEQFLSVAEQYLVSTIRKSQEILFQILKCTISPSLYQNCCTSTKNKQQFNKKTQTEQSGPLNTPGLKG